MPVSIQQKRKLRILLALPVAAILLWGIITPNGFRAAVEVNKWSQAFIAHFYQPISSDQALPLPPASHPHAKLLLAREAIANGDDDLALAYITPLIGPDNPLVTNAYAEITYRHEDFARAISAWEMAGNLTALHNATYELREKKLLDDALKAAISRYHLEPETSTSALATIYTDLKEYDQAVALLDQSMGEFPESKFFVTWLNTKSGVQFLQANDYAANNQLSEAELFYRASVNTNPNNWIAWKKFGWFYYYNFKDSESAANCFKGEMAAYPENGEGQIDLATLYALEKQAQPAGYWYRQAISLRPDRGDFQLHYAKFLRDSKELDEAAEIFDRLSQDFPDYIDAHYEAALTYAQLNQPAKAIQSIERVLQLMNPPVLRYYLLAGSLYEANGMKEKAVEAFKNALLLDPQSPEALNGIKRLSE